MKTARQHVVSDLKCTVAAQAIEELIDHLVSAGLIAGTAKGAIADAVRQRERAMSTGIGFGVALPHATTDLVTESIMAVGRSAGGIDFDALDGQPVHLVVLMIVPPGEREKHLKTLSQLSRLLRNKEIRSGLQQAVDVETMTGILNGPALIAA